LQPGLTVEATVPRSRPKTPLNYGIILEETIKEYGKENEK